VITHFSLERFLAAIRKDLCANLSAALQESKDNRFVVRATLHDSPPMDVAVHVPSLAADESFIDLNFAALTTKFY
jgi:hypothetical protein